MRFSIVKEIERHLNDYLTIIQLIFVYNLYLVIKNLSNEEISVSIDLLKKTIFFVFVCLFIFIMNLFNMFDSKNLKGMFKIFNKKLEKENISHLRSEEFLSDNDLENIQKNAYRLIYWYNAPEIKKFIEYENLVGKKIK